MGQLAAVQLLQRPFGAGLLPPPGAERPLGSGRAGEDRHSGGPVPGSPQTDSGPRQGAACKTVGHFAVRPGGQHLCAGRAPLHHQSQEVDMRLRYADSVTLCYGMQRGQGCGSSLSAGRFILNRLEQLIWLKIPPNGGHGAMLALV